jgi:hypothetical protein
MVYEESGDEYFAGIWKKNLREDICWSRCSRLDLEHFHDRKFQIPSWSWAAVKGEVTPPRMDETLLDSYIRVVDVRVTLASDNPFGDVDGGILTVSSKLFTYCWVNPPQHDNIHENVGLNDDEVIIGGRLLNPIRGQVTWDHEENYGRECALFLVNIRRATRLGNTKCLSALLLKSTDKGKGRYERVGLLEVWGIEGLGGDFMKHLDSALERVSQMLKGPKEDDDFLTEAGCLSVDYDEEGIKWYTITIV